MAVDPAPNSSPGPRPREPQPSSKAATHAGMVATPPTAHAVLRTEWLLQEGPVRTSVDSGQAVVSGRLAADRRWPRLGRLWWCAQWFLQQSGHDRIVHQAVGILISRNCDEGQARARLRRISTATERPLAEVAQMIVDEAMTEAHLQYIVQTPQQRITHVAVGR